MSLRLERFVSLLSDRDPLFNKRQALLQGLKHSRMERRHGDRISVQDSRESTEGRTRARILNFSQVGLAVQVENCCSFARGERHRFTLSQGGTSIDVEGVVCWTRSSWVPAIETGRTCYHQTAGVSVDIESVPEAKREWEFVTSTIHTLHERIEVADSEIVRSCSDSNN